MRNIDDIDKAILNALQSDGKLTMKELAAQLNMSTTPIFERVKRLERDGLIVGYRAIVDPQKVDYPQIIYCSISLKDLSPEAQSYFDQVVCNLTQVQEVHLIAGDYDYLIKMVVRDINEFHEIYNKYLFQTKLLAKANSNFVIATKKATTSIILGEEQD
jgi:DNA-binding Lrp family transcriptional regulator